MDDGLGKHYTLTCENPECGQVIEGRRDYMLMGDELKYCPPTKCLCPCEENGSNMRIEEVNN